ncbi:MAG: glycerophosphodiester phosphodiesterase [Spirochaetales bacterium]|jgi:glycerophosphoryl diester phosphodiesterase|nr:glycerophosphodiester phosphodiesterase [Spirochaetales bacterium]
MYSSGIMEPFLSPMPRIVAHRGDSKHYPENTLEAFLSAVAMGVDVIETDVHLTKDGELVIWHDQTLERNTDGFGLVDDHTLAELKSLDAGYTFSKDGGKTYPFRNKGIRIALLSEALETCPHQRFNVDLKSKNPAIVDAFIQVVTASHAQHRVLCASFHIEHLKRMRTLCPEILTSITTSEVMGYLIRYALKILPSVLSKKRTTVFQVPIAQWGITVVTPRFIEEIHKRNGIIQVWTINDEATMRNLFAMGVDAIMTDDPALALKAASSMNVT